MKTHGIAKRIMAFVVSLMLAFSTVPAGIVNAEPSSDAPSVKLSASDNKSYSGRTVKLKLQLDGINNNDIQKIEFFEGTNPITPSKEGDVYSIENAGEENETKIVTYTAKVSLNSSTDPITSDELEIMVDDTAPTVDEVSIDYSHQNRNTIIIKASDPDGSGVQKVYYDFKAKDQTVYGETKIEATPSDGQWKIENAREGTYNIWAVDNAGKETEKTEKTINFDTDAPKITNITLKDSSGAKISYNDYNGSENKVLSGPVNVVFKASDSLSGIGEVYYTDNDGATIPIETKNGWYSFKAKQTGNYTIYAKDKVGNGPVQQNINLKIDSEAPELTVTATANGKTVESGSWVYDQGSISIKMVAADKPDGDNLGIRKIYWGTTKINKSKVTEKDLEDEANFYKSGNGDKCGFDIICDSNQIINETYYFYAVDNGGKVSNVKTFNACIDRVKVKDSDLKVYVKRSEALPDFLLEAVFGKGYTGIIPINKDYLANNFLDTTIELNKEINDQVKDVSLKYKVKNGRDQLIEERSSEKQEKNSDGKYIFSKISTEAQENVIKITNVELIITLTGGRTVTRKLGSVIVIKNGPTIFAQRVVEGNQPPKVKLGISRANKNVPINSIFYAYPGNKEKDLEAKDIIGQEHKIETVDNNGVLEGYIDYNGTQRIQICAVDALGNCSVATIADTAAPEISIEPENDEWHNKEFELKLKFNNEDQNTDEEKQSAVGVKYKVGEKGKEKDIPVNYNDNTAVLKVEGDQVQTYYFTPYDKAGNKGEAVEKTVRIDTQAPIITMISNSSGGEQTNKDVIVTIKASDIKVNRVASGIKKVVASKDGNNWEDCSYNEAKKQWKYKIEGSQINTYKFKAIDNAGNESEPETTDVNIDQTAPVFKDVKSDHTGEVTGDNVVVDVSVYDPEELTVSDEKDKVVKIPCSGIKKVIAIPLKDEATGKVPEGAKEVEVTDPTDGVYRFTFSESQKAKYVFKAVDNFENENVYEEKQVEVHIDKGAPEIKSVDVGDYDQQLTNKDVVIKVKAWDPAENGVSSGVKSVTAIPVDDSSKDKKVVVEEETDGYYVFTFSESQSLEYRFVVEDNVGNKSEFKDTKSVNIDKGAPEITSVEMKTVDDESVEVGDYDQKYTNKKVIIKVRAWDPAENGVSSGVKSVTAIPVDGSHGGKEVVVEEETDGYYVFKFDTDQEAEYKFVVEDKVGNKSEFKDTKSVKIDKVVPGMENVKVDDTAKYYSFGIFSNNEIKITLKAKDESVNGAASGVKKIVMHAERPDGTIVEDVKENNNDNPFTFTIGSKIFIKDILYKNISFTVYDNAGNSSKSKTLSELFKDGTISDNGLVDTKEPEIDAFRFTKKPDYTDNKGRRWFNTSEVTATVKVRDNAKEGKNASGIKSAYISTQPGSASSTDSEANYKFKDNTDESGEKTLPETSHTLSLTSTAKDVKNDGALTFYAKVTDIAENSFDTTQDKNRKDTVYVDTKAPVVTDIIVNGQSIVGSNNKYLLFSHEKRSIRINAVDTAGANTGASGVKTITYCMHDVTTNKTTTKTFDLPTDGSYIIKDIEPDFKGYITAWAFDNVGNKSEIVTTQRIVFESKDKHNSTSDVNIILPETEYRDIDGKPLYPNNITATISVSDSYSGIKNVEYSLDAQGNNWTKLQGMDVESKDININTSERGTLRIDENRNNIVLKVRLTDNAGNQTTKDVNFSIDTAVPTIDVVFDNNSYNRAYSETQYYKADRTATVTVTERNFNQNDLKAAITASTGAVPVISSFVTHTNTADPDKTTHTATVRFTNDADYTMAIDYTDLAGHAAPRRRVDNFTIDKTLPTTKVTLSSAPKNGKYYNEKQTVTVEVTEHNFDKNLVNISANQGVIPEKSTWQWSDNGDVHTATFVLNSDDQYAFTVNASDKALNNANAFSQPQFVIDQTKPEALITDVEHEKAYGDQPEVHPTIQGKDVNLDKVVYKITKKLRDGSDKDVTKDFALSAVESADGNKMVVSYRGMSFDHTEAFDGIYTIEATVADLAGNTTPVTETFSINRFGANYTIDDQTIKDEVLNNYLKEGREFKIKAINVNPITKDNVEIVVICSGEERKLSDSEFRIVENHSEGGWYEYEFIIDKDVFKNDGSYSLRISASDEAGNVSKSNDDAHNEKVGDIAFFVDSIKPSVSITGADNKQSYKEQSKDITVKVEDANIDPTEFKDSIHVMLNGKELKSEEYDVVNSETGAGVVTLKFNVTDSDAEIVAYGVDLAGNESDHEKLTFKLDQNWLQRFYNNQKGLFFGTLGGIAAVIGAIVFFIIRKKKHR